MRLHRPHAFLVFGRGDEIESDITGMLMYNKIGNLTRLKYVIIAILLFFVGLGLLLTFFLMFTLPFALAAWAWAGIFLYLAAVRRPYADYVATLRPGS